MPQTDIVAPAGQWRGPPHPASPDGSLQLLIGATGEPRDGWVPVEGWRYGGPQGDLIEPATGVEVAADLIPRQQ